MSWIGKWVEQGWTPSLSASHLHLRLLWLPLSHHEVSTKQTTKFSQSNLPGILLSLVYELHPICLDQGASVHICPRGLILRKQNLGQDFFHQPLACPGEEIKPQSSPKTQPGFQDMSGQATLTVLVSTLFVFIINLDLFPEKKNVSFVFIQVSLSHFKLYYNRAHHFYFSEKKVAPCE